MADTYTLELAGTLNFQNDPTWGTGSMPSTVKFTFEANSVADVEAKIQALFVSTPDVTVSVTSGY